MEPLSPQGPELAVSLFALSLFAVTIVGAALALRRELGAGRRIGAWVAAFLFLGPLGVAAYFVRRPRSLPSQ